MSGCYGSRRVKETDLAAALSKLALSGAVLLNAHRGTFRVYFARVKLAVKHDAIRRQTGATNGYMPGLRPLVLVLKPKLEPQYSMKAKENA